MLTFIPREKKNTYLHVGGKNPHGCDVCVVVEVNNSMRNLLCPSRFGA